MRRSTKLKIVMASIITNIGVTATSMYKALNAPDGASTASSWALAFSAGVTGLRNILDFHMVYNTPEAAPPSHLLNEIIVDGDKPESTSNKKVIVVTPKSNTYFQDKYKDEAKEGVRR